MSNVLLFSSIFKNRKDKKERQEEKNTRDIKSVMNKNHRMFVSIANCSLDSWVRWAHDMLWKCITEFYKKLKRYPVALGCEKLHIDLIKKKSKTLLLMLNCERGCLNLVMLHIYSGYEKIPLFLFLYLSVSLLFLPVHFVIPNRTLPKEPE